MAYTTFVEDGVVGDEVDAVLQLHARVAHLFQVDGARAALEHHRPNVRHRRVDGAHGETRQYVHLRVHKTK